MPQSPGRIEIGILTKGKATLSMALVSLLLQEVRDIRVQIVDTSETPIINRDDVVFALRLAFDREIECGYEYSPERERAFSLGRLKLLESLKGPHICFLDDDVVMTASTLSHMLPLVEANPLYGFITPLCRNAGVSGTIMAGKPHYSPGGLIYQDDRVRSILMDYYAETVDVLDQQRSAHKVWEIAFLTELFTQLGRKCIAQPENVVYHLDYHERPNWELLEKQLVRTSATRAREIVSRHHADSSLRGSAAREALSLVAAGQAVLPLGGQMTVQSGNRLMLALRQVRRYLP